MIQTSKFNAVTNEPKPSKSRFSLKVNVNIKETYKVKWIIKNRKYKESHYLQ